LTVDPHRNQPLLQLGAPLNEAGRAMILLHGRGGSAEDILSLSQALGGQEFAYLAPQAANHTWYPNSFLAPLEQNEPYLSSALDRVESIVQLAGAAGIAPENIVVAGFSQGACLATEFVARRPRRYAGLIAFTGGLIGPPGSDLTHAGNLAGTPAFFGSGDPDPHVPWQRVQQSAEILKQMGADVAAHRYPGMPHTVTPSEIETARQHVGTLSIRKGQ
jgi:phospholipase/carboxylesterase